MVVTVRIVLSAFLFTLAIAKALSGHRPSFIVPEWLFWGVAVMEAAAAFMLWTSWARWTSLGLSFVFCLAGAAVQWNWWGFGGSGKCGCLGGTEIPTGMRVGLAMAVSALACVLGLLEGPKFESGSRGAGGVAGEGARWESD